MSELFLLLDQLLGLAWIFPTLHRNYVSIQRPQKPCLRKQLRAAHRQSASASLSLTIDNTNRRGCTSIKPHHYLSVPSASCPPTGLLHLLYVPAPLCFTVLG